MTETKLKKLGYCRRWLAETFVGSLKQTMASTLNAPTERGLMANEFDESASLNHPALAEVNAVGGWCQYRKLPPSFK